MTLSAKTLTAARTTGSSGLILWIRTSAGPQTGFGHLQRCLTLARALQSSVAPFFLVDPDDGWTRQHLAQSGWEYCFFGSDDIWSEMPDPAGILVDTRITTGLHDFIANAQSRGIPVISIHDLGLAPLDSDTVVDGSIIPLPIDSFSRSRKRISGTEYMVLDPAYGRLHRYPKQIRERIRTVFINLGGGNSAKYFPIVLEGLKRWSHALDAVGVPGFVSWGQDIIGHQDWHPLCFRWETGSSARILFQSDLAITAGGLSAYEALCVGTPVAALSYDPMQQSTIATLSGKGACVDLGPGDELDPLKLSAACSWIDADVNSRRALSARGREIVDGQGVERVAEIIRREIFNHPSADYGRLDGSSAGL